MTSKDFEGFENNMGNVPRQMQQSQIQQQEQHIGIPNSPEQHMGIPIPNEHEQEVQLDRQNSNPVDIVNMQDPFRESSFNEENIPDVPLPDQGAAMLNALLNDDVVPDNVKEKFWFVFHRDNILSFLDAERKKSKLLNFDILKIDSLHSTPYYDYTFNNEYLWNTARHMFETKLDRALGIGGKNERTVIPMTIQETINRNVPEGQEVRSGFLKRMLNRR